MIKVSIVIVSFNTKRLTIQCISSIFKYYKKEIEDKQFEILLVDNNSDDNTAGQVEDLFDEVIIVKNKENYGFGKGNNIGAKKASGEFLLFLNSDTIVNNTTIGEMVNFLDDRKDIGIAGGEIIDKNGRRQKSGGTFYNLFNVLSENHFSPKSLQEIDWVEGSFFMIRHDLFTKINGFDEHFFMYVEDMELCFRVKRLGYKIYYFPKSTIIHLIHGSSNRSFAIVEIYKGILYFYKKHKSRIEYNLVKFLLAAKAVAAIIIGFVSRNTYLTRTYKEALATIL